MKLSMMYILIIPIFYFGAGGSKDASQTVTYNGGPAHTGYYDSLPLYELRGLKWKYDTGAGLVTSPLLAYDSCLYFGDGEWNGVFWKRWKRVRTRIVRETSA